MANSEIKKPSKYQRAIYTAFQKTDKNINISAVAGSGKTTVLLNLLNFVPVGTPSLFLAFNKSIVNELNNRNSRQDVSIMTIHSCGWRAIMQRYGNRITMNANKSIVKTDVVLKKFDIPSQRRAYFFYAIPKILDLMRCNLCENNVEAIRDMLDWYDIEIDEKDMPLVVAAFELVRNDKSCFDFMDMVYVPATDPHIRLRKYDYVFCDESQDFSLCQHQFIKKCLGRKGRLITVGDKRQAIYGFAGADANSYELLSKLNGPSLGMPLSVSYRCAREIVKEAQEIVPNIFPAPNAPQGEVYEGSLTELKYGDWVICRNLKPLVQTYLWLMKNKIKAKIRGKDIGEGLILLINKTGASTVSTLFSRLEREKEKLHQRLTKKGVSRPNLHPKMEILQQKIEVIECLCNEIQNVSQLKRLIENIFSDDVQGIMLSTIHKCKGLENDTIFFLCPELIPSRYAIQDWQVEQEMNLKYVGITRAKSRLVYVLTPNFTEDIKSKVNLCKE